MDGMSLSDDIRSVLEADGVLMILLTGGIHIGVEELSRENTPTAFDATTRELKPSALVKIGVESRLRSGIDNSVNTPFTIYFYDRQGYDNIEQAMSLAFTDLNETKIGDGIWNVEFDLAVHQQRDAALDCALGSLRFIAKRRR
jgi:hypothetical protein